VDERSVIGRARPKAVLGVSAGGGRLYFYQPWQDGPDEHNRVRSVSHQISAEMEFGQAIAATKNKLQRLTVIFSNLIVADVGIIYINLPCLGSINLVAKIIQ